MGENTITYQIGNRRRDVVAPTSWNDLDMKSLLMFYQTLFTNLGDEFTGGLFTSVKLITMAQKILKMSASDMAKWEADCLQEDPENGAEIFAEELRQVIHATLGGLFEVLHDEKNGVTRYACRLNLTKNPFSKMAHTPAGKQKKKAKTTWLYCAADGLENITIYELGQTFTLFENYLATKDEHWADRLIGTLYRPAKPPTRQNTESGYGGDKRQPFRGYESKVAERAELARTLPPLTRRVILFWFASCRQGIVAAFPKVFKRKKDSDENKVGYGWGGVLLSIAGGPTGLDAIADQNYGNALTWLSMKADEREEAERQAEQAKSRRRR